MTGRERIQNVLSRRPVDRLSWTTLADDRARSLMPADVRELPVLDFYRYLGCDVVQFGNFGLPEECRASFARSDSPVQHRRSQENGTVTDERVTPWGTLVAQSRTGHPTTYPVASLDDVRLLTRIWRETRFEDHPAAAASCTQAEAAVGDDGLYFPTLPPSPVQQLIEAEMGLERFYYLLYDHPAEMAGLLDAMHQGYKQRYEIVARRTAAPALIAVENTSSTLTSPDVYRRYSLPQLSDYARIVHEYGKKLILHMCGKLRALLELIAETGADGINALTPPQTGDCPFEHALDVLGDDLVILGGILPTEAFHAAGATKDDIWRLLDATCTPRVRRAHFVLWVAVDGLPTPLWKFHAVQEWMDRNGRL